MTSQNRRIDAAHAAKCALSGVVLGGIVASPLMPAAATDTEQRLVKAHHTTYGASNTRPLVFNAATDGFEGQGRPQSRSSGGSRAGCETLLIALLPGEGALSDTEDCDLRTESFTALTTEATPILWFYIPELEGGEAELALLDENQRAIAVDSVALPGAAGVVGIPITQTLEVEQAYPWVFSVAPSSNPSRILTVEGTIRRVALEAEEQQQIDAAIDPRDRVVLLAEAGIWHDALSALGDLRQQLPENMTVKEDWRQLLESVGLGAIADIPVVE
ncbi:MAG: DUF928 domain-containing protein [Cyanobacteria bacterium P01_A01_bin.135]